MTFSFIAVSVLYTDFLLIFVSHFVSFLCVMRGKKTSVKLRRKRLADGSDSLYLDIYYNGKRRYEYLKLYIDKNTDTSMQRDINRRTMAQAERMRSKCLYELLEHGDVAMIRLDNKEDGKLNIVEFTKKYLNKANAMALARKVDTYVRIQMGEYTNKIIKGILDKMISELSPMTVERYSMSLKLIMRKAVELRIIPESVKVDIVRCKSTHRREFLSMEELRRLIETPAPHTKHERRRDAFLFSCFTGLRISDIERLRWADVSQVDGYTRITFTQKKTRELEYMDITENATRFMGKRGIPSELVFGCLNKNSFTYFLTKWMRKAGIEKHITFHCARHTFAVMMIELGTDLYVTSKLLGHRKIETTQVYTRVLDKSKREAIDRIPKF